MRSVATPDDAPAGQSVNRDTSPRDRHTHERLIRPIDHPPFRRLLPARNPAGPGATLRAHPRLGHRHRHLRRRVPRLLLVPAPRQYLWATHASRRLLAVRLHRSVDAVDRAVRELADTGLVRIQHRRDGRRNLTNRYHLTTQEPDASRAARHQDEHSQGRKEHASQHRRTQRLCTGRGGCRRIWKPVACHGAESLGHMTRSQHSLSVET
jgi:hypothetical protein